MRMPTNLTSQLAIFDPRVVVTFTLCLAGTLLTPRTFAATDEGPYRRPGYTERVSVANDGSQANSWSQTVALSADARYAVFTSAGSNLVLGDTNGKFDVFVRDLIAGTTRLVSVASDGTQGNLDSGYAPILISGDGQFVAFWAAASNLVPADTNNNFDVFVHDQLTGTTELVSKSQTARMATLFRLMARSASTADTWPSKALHQT